MSANERRSRERNRRRALIVAAARGLAEEGGWGAVTTRRLSERIEYSQPVLYSHFSGMDDVAAAVAVEGFAELADEVNRAQADRTGARETLTAVISAYLDFAEANPAVYDAMFSRRTPLPFASDDTPPPLRAAFDSIVSALAPHTADRDPGTFAEVVWAAVHGQATLDRDHRLRPGERDARVALLVDLLTR